MNQAILWKIQVVVLIKLELEKKSENSQFYKLAKKLGMEYEMSFVVSD